METREIPPAHFLIKIESFSLLDSYETKKFAAGGYDWRLIINPNGDDNDKDCEYVSVNLAMADTSSLPANWEVNALFSISLFNQISGNYLSSLGVRRSFLGMKSQWGLSNFISKKILLDQSNGYLINDTCVFGAEVFVIKREAVTEYLSLKKDVIPYKRDWTISNFSQLGDYFDIIFNSVINIRKISLDPRGNGEGTGSHVSIFLYYLGSERVEACYTICIKNQVNDEPKKRTGKSTTSKIYSRSCRLSTNWFSGGTSWYSSQPAWGWPTFIELDTINDPKKGLVVNDSCLLNIEISLQALAK
ncbi:hypothetical protein MIMGU_mgv1a018450mg [Erythranthe guttata]|uniref:MATH domain-containing protein n=1 Tax=Erythranthe guttata TaxID=4155 RepID=A0A022RMK8_ERYGU|nr:hypothetical protein MIMGU_mgv1a018450mg [Erythranthe guttata]